MPIVTISRVYSDAAVKNPREYYEYLNYEIPYGDIEKYRLVRYMGKGKYSQVFEGRVMNSKSRCVIKVLKPVKEKKINREIMILKKLAGVEGVVQLMDVVKDPYGPTTSLIFAYEEHRETRTLFSAFTLEDIRYYGRRLLGTLDYIHSKGIFHRDVKPHNIVINHEKRVLRLIDWGLAEFYVPGTAYTVGVASMHFKAPELLLGHKTYDYGTDIWAFGCVLAEMVLKRMPLFNGSSNEEQVLKISKMFGGDKVLAYAAKYELGISSGLHTRIASCSGEAWERIREEPNLLLTTKEEREQVFDVLEGVFRIDHGSRLTARECLDMPFFASEK